MISVVIPVLDGSEYLEEVLDAVWRQQLAEEFEILVIDSGSTDGSIEIIKSFPAVRLIEIDKSEFGHGRTRNRGVRETSGDLIAFLTQDATPASEHWLAAYRAAFELEPKIGAAFGTHLPRKGVSPLMARLLIDHFNSFSDDGTPAIQHPGDTPYLSNSNSCIARAAWEQTPFRDIAYSEDQAFGADILANGWSKVYAPDAAAWHSHDYGTVETFKRYFDEYRGLNDSVGEKTDASASKAFSVVSESVAKDSQFLKAQGYAPMERAAWTARSAFYHVGRVGFGGLGARADKMPPRVRQALSFEGRSDGVGHSIAAKPSSLKFAEAAEVEVSGVVPLSTEPSSGGQLHIAWVVPPFGVGGGGHTTIFRMIQALEQSGHRCSIWVHDPSGIEGKGEGALVNRINEHYMQLDATVHRGFRHWTGADIAVATGWDTVYKVLRLDKTRSRAYFVQDHEPEFYANSSESVFATRSYMYGLPCICASPWLAQLVQQRYGAASTPFLLGVDTDEYAPAPDVARREDTIVFYARHFTARRAVELGLLALEEVHRRRPETRIVLYGAGKPLSTPFPHEHLGVVSPERLRRLYSEATIGLSLSLTNYSLIPQEMMACGLPVVELAGRACEGVFGSDGSVITLANDNVADVADRMCDLLDEPLRRAGLSNAGIEFCAVRPWSLATQAVEHALMQVHAAQGGGAAAKWRPGALV
jgi:glycosyltransferase involved in cell wall biosynthesis